MNKRIISAGIIGLSYFSLTGFIFGDPESEASDFIRDTRNRIQPSANLDLGPLPEMQEYQPYLYVAGSSDPFKLKTFVTDVAEELNAQSTECQSVDCGDTPPVPHTPYFLEGYDLSVLKMTGTMSTRSKPVAALIRTPDAGILEARVGEYIGRDNGLILSIHPDHIVIQEKYKVPRGWQNRMATLELFD